MRGRECDPVRRYNGAPAHTETIEAGTELWRVHRTDSKHPANSFNSTGIASLVDALRVDIHAERFPRQGRFEPVHDPVICPGGAALGGYVYLGHSVAAAVAEGIIRGSDIPKTQLLPYAAIAEASITKVMLGEDITIAVFDTQAGLASINQDNSLVACTWRDYRESRITCTQILLGSPTARGVRYKCRHGMDETAFMLVDRGDSIALDVVDSSDLAEPGWGRDLIVDALRERFSLSIDLP